MPAARRNPALTDERLYQHARRSVVAELQKITYDEFLPALIGPARPGAEGLRPYAGYRADVNPGIATEFSTVAFRVGHSMLGEDIEFLAGDGTPVRDPLSLRDAFFNPTPLSEVGIEPILKYLGSFRGQEIDTRVVDDVRNFLFGSPGQGGFDLAALNIQRGRDHGIADYNRDGLRQGTERGLANVAVSLVDAAGAVVASGRTNPLGEYAFARLGLGSYRVVVASPAGGAAGTARAVQVTRGGAVRGVDVGLAVQAPAPRPQPPRPAPRPASPVTAAFAGLAAASLDAAAPQPWRVAIR